MRIGVDCRPLASPRTGIGRYLAELLQRMADGEHQWFLYSDQHVSVALASEHILRHGNVTTGAMSTAFAQLHFGRWARSDRLDVYWSPRHHLPFNLDMPSVVTIHDLVWRKCPQSMIRLGWLAERALMPFALKHAARVLVPSNSTGQDVAEYRPETRDRIRVVPLAANLTELPPAVPSHFPAGVPYALVVGTIEPRKNHMRILNAFDKVISETGSNYHLVVVGGEGWKADDVMKRLRKAERRIWYAGSVTDQELAYVYANAEFVVAPSLYEGFGLQLLEAMSFGRPIITSNVASMPEVAGDAALLVDPRSTEEISRAMQTLMFDASLRRELGRRGHRQATGYSWHRSAIATLEALTEAATG